LANSWNFQIVFKSNELGSKTRNTKEPTKMEGERRTSWLHFVSPSANSSECAQFFAFELLEFVEAWSFAYSGALLFHPSLQLHHSPSLVFCEVLKKKCPWDVDTMGYATNGYLNIVKWLREAACPWDDIATQCAAQEGHSGVLEWAVSQGVSHECPQRL